MSAAAATATLALSIPAGNESPQTVDAAPAPIWFPQFYENYISTFVKRGNEPYRVPILAPVDLAKGMAGWREVVKESALKLHGYNRIQDPKTGRWLSIGVVRAANIKGVVPLALHLAKALPGAHVASYHSQLFTIHRAYIERRLDELLTRKPKEPGGDPNWRIWEDPEIRGHLDDGKAHDLLYIVVASPVEEIGRDHDFDYGVIEPTSSASIVQTCGRVGRHRLEPKTLPNVAILQYNRKAVLAAAGKNYGGLVFSKPGLETEAAPYGTTDLAKLLDWDGLGKIDASLRFGAHKLAQLDDESLRQSLAYPMRVLVGAKGCDNLWMAGRYYTDYALRDDKPKQDWTYNVAEDTFYQLQKAKGKPATYVEKGNKVTRVAGLPRGWLQPSLAELVDEARRYGVSLDSAFSFKLPAYDETKGWAYYAGWGMVT